ncbi:hypothetical protein LCGC14_2805650 [marine sediment metagenome]|uniref:N-acetyltransferase domain-containing protein n=1 Tax=marine sediment metagenome TaxID=412755 RepID=A0A0F8Z856_9ZZZZ
MEDFRIHKLIYSEIKSVYPELFKRIFKEDSSTQIPSYVYVGFVKEEYVGLISAYIHNANSLYISFAGFVDKFKGYRAVILFKQVIEFIHKDSIRIGNFAPRWRVRPVSFQGDKTLYLKRVIEN